MKRFGHEAKFIFTLIALSAFLYFVHYAIFQDLNHISLWSMTSLAFLPISVLLVTLIIDKLLNKRERRTRMEKLNIIIGTFFSKAGTTLLAYFSDWDPQLENIRGNLIVTKGWSDKEFHDVSKQLRNYDFSIDIKKLELGTLRDFLVEKSDFLLRLLENQNLLEQESFTELLQAVFHLAEEIDVRENIRKLPDTDLNHLVGDIKRVYILLTREWLAYMKYLKKHYPYLFFLAMRRNPFDRDATPIVT